VLEKSWDRFMIPLPFGRIHFAYGQPLLIVPGAAPADLEQAMEMLSGKLDLLQQETLATGRPQ
jgi:lysophospholipid acyltransferase (LPLAT)-like uncharacterized protein